MRASTEEFLYILLWTAESFLQPTWHNLMHDSFEAWASRNGLGRRLAQLERRKLIERLPATATERAVRLTKAGRINALGGRDPLTRWSRAWDGQWRLVLFDLPVHATALRSKLRRLLRAEGFGFLHNSVWLTPDSLENTRQLLRSFPAEPESFILFEGRPGSNESDAELVRSARDFAEINARYQRYLDILRAAPHSLSRRSADLPRTQTWLRRERLAWKNSLVIDPLLPLRLQPENYLGRQAWDARLRLLRSLATSPH